MALRAMCVVFGLLVFLRDGLAQDVIFTGTTTSIHDRDENNKPLEKSTYEPLQDVNVYVTRSTQLAKTMSDIHGRFGLLNQDGKPTLAIDAGMPVMLLFVGDEEIVPEMQQLSAKVGTRQIIHVTLLNVRQYQALYGRDALVKKIEYIMGVLEKCDGDDIKVLRLRLAKQLNRWRG